MSMTEPRQERGTVLSRSAVALAQSHSPSSLLSFSVAFLLPGSAHSTLPGNTHYRSLAGTPEILFVCGSWREDIGVSVLNSIKSHLITCS